jgi:nucleoside-diphosphate-sugar epimerase
MSGIQDGEPVMKASKTILILGATGGIGGEVAKAALRRGWAVRALNRHAERVASDRRGIEWVQGDAMNEADVVAAARGVDVIVHAVNPPAYKNWALWVLPMLRNTLSAARQSGARIVLPGTLYNYGPETFPLIAENAPQQPRTRKGAIRVQMETLLRESGAQGVRSLIVRAGDYFGPTAGNNWFSQMVTAGKPVSHVMRIGKKDVGHQWGYLPDVAETMLRLLDIEDRLKDFENVHMAGHWDDNGMRMVEAIQRAVAQPVTVRAFPWWLLAVIWPFVRLLRELHEMRYLWMRPVRLNNARLLQLLGNEPHTPLDQAIEASLRGIGCLQEQDTRQSISTRPLPRS